MAAMVPLLIVIVGSAVAVAAALVWGALGERRRTGIEDAIGRAALVIIFVAGAMVPGTLVAAALQYSYARLTGGAPYGDAATVTFGLCLISPFLLLQDPKLITGFRLSKEMKKPDTETNWIPWSSSAIGKRWYRSLEMSEDDAITLLLDYERARSEARYDEEAYRPASSLPADQVTIRCALKRAYGAKSPLITSNASILRDAYAYTAYFVDDRLADAMNRSDGQGAALKTGRGGRGQTSWGKLPAVNSGAISAQIMIEARHLESEWDAYTEMMNASRDAGLDSGGDDTA